MTELPPHLRARLNDVADNQVADVVARIDKELQPANAVVGMLIAALLLGTPTALAPTLGGPWWAGLLAGGWLLAGLMSFNLRRRAKATAKAVRATRAKTEAEALRQLQERER